MFRLVQGIDRAIAAIESAAMWLALPMALLLFAQWPLRDLVTR